MTYYIATDGDDAAAGTQDVPLKSLSVALEKAQDGNRTPRSGFPVARSCWAVKHT